MLVIDRCVDERIRIGDDVEVVICGLSHGGKVRIGIEAPRHVPVLREELVGTEAGEALLRRAAAAACDDDGDDGLMDNHERKIA